MDLVIPYADRLYEVRVTVSWNGIARILLYVLIRLKLRCKDGSRRNDKSGQVLMLDQMLLLRMVTSADPKSQID